VVQIASKKLEKRPSKRPKEQKKKQSFYFTLHCCTATNEYAVIITAAPRIDSNLIVVGFSLLHHGLLESDRKKQTQANQTSITKYKP
jgi:hypothetical protein